MGWAWLSGRFLPRWIESCNRLFRGSCGDAVLPEKPRKNAKKCGKTKKTVAGAGKRPYNRAPGEPLMATKKRSGKYSFINQLYEGILSAAEVTRKGTIRLKRADLKNLIETAFSD